MTTAHLKLSQEKTFTISGEGPIPVERRILVLAPTGNDAMLTAQVLAKARIAVQICSTITELTSKMAAGCGGILLAEETLKTDAVSVLVAGLAQQPTWSDIPVIIITSGGEADQTRLRRLAVFGPASNVTLLERPFRPGTLISAVEVALRSRLRQYQTRDLLQTVQASEERYQHILASISDAFIAIDRDWCITYVNSSYLRLMAPLELSAGKLIGRNLWKTLPVHAESETRFREAMVKQKPDAMEVFYAALQMWLEVRIYPSPETLTIYLRDITESKRQKDELLDLSVKIQDQARTFDAALSHITDFAYTFDRQGRFTYVNKPLLDLWGLTLDQAVGKNFFELNYPEDVAQKLQRQIQDVIHTGKPLKDETPYTNPSGMAGYYEYIFNPIFSADGSVEAIAGSTRDVSERKRTEERLRHSDAQVSAIIKHSPIGVYLVDTELRIQQVNLKAQPVFGNIRDLIGRSFVEVMRVLWPVKIAEKIESRFRATLETGESYFESGFVADRADRADREYYDWQIHRVVLPDGRFGVVCYFIDISSHVAAQQKIREARDLSEQANRAKDDFLAALSHELRTPLNPVLLLATEAASNPDLSPELRANFDMIAKNVLLEAHLIDDLLDLTRITRGKVVLDTRPIAVHGILQDAIANVKAEMLEKRLTMTTSFGLENPIVDGDPVRLQQVFWNVLKNAVKFTEAGGRIAVTTRTIYPQGCVLVEITDTGAGMNAQELGRIFDAFAQGDHANIGSSHRFGGLGLGLAISRSLVEMHSGTIRASSPGCGQGSTFAIELPLVAVPNVLETHPAAPLLAQRNSTSPFRGLRILLVEDHNPTRAVLARLLQVRNHKVVAAASVGEARKFGAMQTFDLLITDIGLPDGNGYELMEEMGKLPNLRGIALTGYGAEQDVERAQKTGFIAHLTKPVSIRTLDGVLDSVLLTTAASGADRPSVPA